MFQWLTALPLQGSGSPGGELRSHMWQAQKKKSRLEFLFFFFFGYVAYGVLVPRSEIKPAAPWLKV